MRVEKPGAGNFPPLVEKRGFERIPPQEREDPFDAIEFYVTDHSADKAETGDLGKLRKLYADIKRDGVESIRYDWRWSAIEPQKNNYSQEHLDRYAHAREIMDNVGLKEPTIILSSIPPWAQKLYKEDKQAFFRAYRDYAQAVSARLTHTPGRKINRVQILNELNNGIFTPVGLDDIPELCRLTREVFRAYNPDVKLMATLLASNTTRAVGIPIEDYLPRFKTIKDNFDVIAVDYYPGFWHLPAGETPRLQPLKLLRGFVLNRKALFKDMVKNLGLLRNVFEEIAGWGKDYELGEVGLPTKKIVGGEMGQRYFYDAFFRAYKQLLIEFRARGLRLPGRVGFYEAKDEESSSLRQIPERDWGMRYPHGKRKLILQGNRHGPDNIASSSQLSRIINYIRKPMLRRGNRQNEDTL